MSQKILLGGVGAFLCVVTFILLAVYGSYGAYCVEYEDGLTYSCGTNSAEPIGYGCFGIVIEQTDYTTSGSVIEAYSTSYYTCPWSTGTEILGGFGVIVGIGFLGTIVFLDTNSSSAWIAGVVSSASLFLAVIVMIVDMAVGRTYYNNNYGNLQPTNNSSVGYSTNIVGFAMNIVVAFFAFLVICVVTLAAKRTGKDSSISEAQVQFKA